MGGLIAVLNTNFWLATHVTTVTMGYSAGLLAAASGTSGSSCLGRAVERRPGPHPRAVRVVPPLRPDDPRRPLLRPALLRGGTILGGVWANDVGRWAGTPRRTGR